MNDRPRRYLPLYEAKMVFQYNHRYGTYEGAKQSQINSGILPKSTAENLADPRFAILPRYWILDEHVHARTVSYEKRWFLGYRRVTNPVTERSTVFAIVPYVGINDKFALLLPQEDDAALSAAVLLSNVNSFVLDYVLRLKISYTNIAFFTLKQLPVIPPRCYSPPLLDFIRPRVLELTYTAWDLQPFARDLGYAGPPFVFDAERRFWLRCELDALYFHLYGISRDDAAYILDSFPIVKRKDEAAYGDYRSQRVILQLYDELAALPTMPVPAPRAADGALEAPDVSAWLSPLQPPPGMAGA